MMDCTLFNLKFWSLSFFLKLTSIQGLVWAVVRHRHPTTRLRWRINGNEDSLIVLNLSQLMKPKKNVKLPLNSLRKLEQHF